MGKCKSISRNSPCENCLICTKVTKMHEFNDIHKLLVEVEMWDLDIPNQYHSDKWSYECLVCNFKTNTFIDWKCHIMSISHLADSHRLKNLVSLVDTKKNNKMVIYGTNDCINQYKKNHSVGSHSTGIQALMSEVMRRFLLKLPPLYYCSHCKKFSNEPLHTDKKLVASLKVPVEYFCKSCSVYFYSSPEMIDCHSLTVEHLTLKCYNHLCSIAKMNSKKMKLSESEQLDQSEKTENLPIIVLNGFIKTSKTFGKCKCCDSSVIWNIKSIVSHLSICQYRNNLKELNIFTSSVSIFECTICEYSTEIFTEFMKHIVTQKHLLICYKNNYYSFFCRDCNSLMCSYAFSIISHLLENHKIWIEKVPTLSKFMKNVFKEFNKNPNKTEIVHYHGDQDSSALSKVSFLCSTCKIKFHTSIDDYNIHMITSEHIILKLMSPNISVTIKDNFKTTVKIPAIKSIVPLNKKHVSIIVDSNKQKNNALINKNPTNFDDPLQGNIKKLQKLLPVNNILPDKSKSPESNNNIELTLSQSRNSNQYTKYFKHKIKLLNLLRQYKDRVLNTLSYCCIECDIICEEKPIWDKHNETKHMSHSTRTTIFCSTCSMLIVGENANDHNGTMEHCILLKFIQSLKPVEEDLIQKTKIMDTVKNSTSINKETEKQQLEMKIVGSTKECQYPVKSIKINVGSHTTQKASLLNKESLVMNNTLPPKDMNDQNKYEINSRTSNPVKLNEITSTHSYSLSTSSTVVYQEDVEIKKHKNMNCIDIINKDNLTHEVDKEIFCEPHTQIKTEISEDIEPDNKVASISSLSTAPLLTHVSNFFNTEQASTFNEDKAYGKYITMRLQHFKDETVKKNIILETFNFINKKVVPEPIDNGTPTNEGPLITYSNLLNPSLTNMLSENVDGINLQEDLNYGKYVTLRLRNIKNKKLKQDIKLEIDNIFYVKMRQSVI